MHASASAAAPATPPRRRTDGATLLVAALIYGHWLPYERYRALHVAHHATEHLTLPGFDPEARYLAADAGPLQRLSARLTSTLLGRLTAAAARRPRGDQAPRRWAIPRSPERRTSREAFDQDQRAPP